MNSILARLPQMLRRIGCGAALALCTMAVGFALPASAATGTVNKADYQPGELVYITGSGFQGGETVSVIVLHADGTPSTGNDHLPWTVTANASGGFNTTW